MPMTPREPPTLQEEKYRKYRKEFAKRNPILAAIFDRTRDLSDVDRAEIIAFGEKHWMEKWKREYLAALKIDDRVRRIRCYDDMADKEEGS